MINRTVFFFLFFSFQLARSQSKIQIATDSLPALNPGYSQALAVNGRLLFIAGQVPVDRSGNLAGRGNFAEQAEQVFRRIDYLLRVSGAKHEQLVKVTYYIVGLDDARLAAFRQVAAGHSGGIPPVATLVGVAALFRPGVLIEADAIAVLN